MLNKVILIGNVGKDPEIRYFEKDQAVANFSLATTERGYKTRDGQEIPDRTEWHNIVAWRGLAKLAENYIKKGSQIYVEGKLKTRSYDDANGVKRYTTEIYADVIQLLGRRQDSDSGSFQTPKGSTNVGGSTQGQSSGVQEPPQSGRDILQGENDYDDDLPF